MSGPQAVPAGGGSDPAANTPHRNDGRSDALNRLRDTALALRDRDRDRDRDVTVLKEGGLRRRAPSGRAHGCDPC